MINYLYYSIIAFVTSFCLTWILRQYALSANIIDTPNGRSSHTIPTPRGGGVSFVFTFLIAELFYLFFNDAQLHITFAVFGAGLIVAVIGFMDDRGHIPARWRLLGHFCASLWAVFWLQGLPPLMMLWLKIDIGWLSYILCTLYLVWMLNLYNFMDGIDGLAGVELLTSCMSLALIYFLAGHFDMVFAPLILSISVAGFLCWNFPRARIFMGDAGSGFLGILLGIFSIQAAWIAQEFFWSWLIVMGVFIVDATVTLLRRLIRGDKVYEAHRSHAYQFAARQYGKHAYITIAVAAINIFWLLPIAMAVCFLSLDGLVAVVIAYFPLIALALKYRAGQQENIKI
ncbi:glycosyltransferase family 4 protein [Pseudomonas saxonica]|uniref:Glycosyltransferase family 4 protein n=1 Tax=Pseudomonas saxonica TaxID=2600598 RepID=A0ABY3GML5_9PSED|nr:glycosyltransferase family 4 protein [Pseudomonas saxonica]TWR92316.1 glycosyltransferase family 4 protein [Pseudomonas saxonica]